MLQHCTSTGGNWAEKTHSTASMLPNTEFSSLNGINTADKGFDLLRQLMRTRQEIDKILKYVEWKDKHLQTENNEKKYLKSIIT